MNPLTKRKQKTTPQPPPPAWLFNGHLQTIAPSLFRKIDDVQYQNRERINTRDGDFLDLDWHREGSNRLLLYSHGLEGDSQRQYIKGAIRHFRGKGFDQVAWNCRSCSGEMNLTKKLYHHADIEDIEDVITHILDHNDYEEIYLLGYSMGGNISLNYAAKRRDYLPTQIKGVLAFSPPCRIDVCARQTEMGIHRIYREKFFRRLKIKLTLKAKAYPGLIDVSDYDRIKTWREFDERFTCILNDFDDPDSFYREASSANFIHLITVPTLIVNALNDPICPPASNPIEEAEANPFVTLETPEWGGHCGFNYQGLKYSWMDDRAEDFITSL